MVTTLGSAVAARPAIEPGSRLRSFGVLPAVIVVEPKPLPLVLLRSAAQ